MYHCCFIMPILIPSVRLIQSLKLNSCFFAKIDAYFPCKFSKFRCSSSFYTITRHSSLSLTNLGCSLNVQLKLIFSPPSLSCYPLLLAWHDTYISLKSASKWEKCCLISITWYLGGGGWCWGVPWESRKKEKIFNKGWDCQFKSHVRAIEICKS